MCVHLCTHVFALQHTSVCLCGHVFTHMHILQAQCLGKKGYYKILILLGLEIKEKLKEFTIKAFRHNLNKLIDARFLVVRGGLFHVTAQTMGNSGSKEVSSWKRYLEMVLLSLCSDCNFNKLVYSQSALFFLLLQSKILHMSTSFLS